MGRSGYPSDGSPGTNERHEQGGKEGRWEGEKGGRREIGGSSHVAGRSESHANMCAQPPVRRAASVEPSPVVPQIMVLHLERKGSRGSR